MFIIGDLVLCIVHYSQDEGSKPLFNESCVVEDVDGDEILLEGYDEYFSLNDFKLMCSK